MDLILNQVYVSRWQPTLQPDNSDESCANVELISVSVTKYVDISIDIDFNTMQCITRYVSVCMNCMIIAVWHTYPPT